MKDLMTQYEVMALLKCSRSTMRNLKIRGFLIPNGKVLNRVVYKKEDVKKYIDNFYVRPVLN